MVSGWAVGSRAPSRRASRTRLSRPPADPAHAHRPPRPGSRCRMPSRRPGLPRHPNAAPSVRDRRSPAHPASCTPRRCPATARRSARRLSRAPCTRRGSKVGRSGRGRGAPRTHSSTAASMVDRRSRPSGGRRSARGPLPASEPTETDRNHADPGWGEQYSGIPPAWPRSWPPLPTTCRSRSTRRRPAEGPPAAGPAGARRGEPEALERSSGSSDGFDRGRRSSHWAWGR
jgi:hypothetical protein